MMRRARARARGKDNMNLSYGPPVSYVTFIFLIKKKTYISTSIFFLKDKYKYFFNSLNSIFWLNFLYLF